MNISRRLQLVCAQTGTRLASFALLALVAASGCGGGENSTGDRGSTGSGTGGAGEGGGGAGGANAGGANAGGGGAGGGDLCSGVVCAPLDACHVAGKCDPATGMCDNPKVADGSPCPCGQCFDGVCSAKELGETAAPMSNPRPERLAVDANNLYIGNSFGGFAGEATITSLPKGGGQPAKTIASGFTGYPDLVVSGTDVYYLDQVALWKVPADGSAMPTQIAPAENLSAITADSLNLYVARPNVGDVRSIPILGGMPVTIAMGEAKPARIVTDGTHVYWLNRTNMTIRKRAIAGGMVSTLTPTQQAPIDLAVDATHVYWTETAAGTVNKVPIGGGAVTVLASGQSDPYGITVAGAMVYWTNINAGALGTVWKAPTAGGGAPTLIANLSGASIAMTHDAMCVYWIDVAAGTAWSAPL